MYITAPSKAFYPVPPCIFLNGGNTVFLPVEVLRLDEVGHGLGLVDLVGVVVVVVAIVLGADVVHLVDAAALGAALDGALAGHLVSSERVVSGANGQGRGRGDIRRAR